MHTNDKANPPSGTEERVPDQREVKDTDGVAERTESPETEPGDTGFDLEAPGNFVDDTHSADVPEPNEPA